MTLSNVEQTDNIDGVLL